MKNKGKCPYPGECQHEKKGYCYNPSVMGFCPPEIIEYDTMNNEAELYDQTIRRAIQADCWKALLAKAQQKHAVTIHFCNGFASFDEPIFTIVTADGEMIAPPGSAELLENWLVKK